MDKKEIKSSGAPEAIGPYSQGVAAGDLLFVSGQIPLDPSSGQVVEGGIREQTLRVLLNIESILSSHGLGLEDVVRSEVFLADIADFGEMNEVYAEKFSAPVKPARYVVGVSALPRNVKIEMSCIAQAGQML